jgi:signal transduction histidine kinase
MTSPRPWSLRNRLLAVVLVMSASAWVVGGVVTARAAHDIAARLRDDRLEQLSRSVLAFARHELAESGYAPIADGATGTALEPPEGDRQVGLDLRYRYQVWWRGKVVMSSPGTALESATAASQAAGRAQPDPTAADVLPPAGFGTGWLRDRPTRRYVSAPDDAGLQVLVDEQLGDEQSALVWPGWRMVLLMLLSLAAVGGVAAVLVMRALRPVAVAEAALRRRGPHELDPVPIDRPPEEMRPLLEALNDNLARAAERLSRERGFTALAAHELRTPLAALRMQVQVAMRVDDGPAGDDRLAAVLASVDRCDRLIGQLLTLARIEQGSGGPQAPLDLRELALRVADELEAERQLGSAHVRVNGPALPVTGWSFALGVLLRNLLDNAVSHGAPGAEIQVVLAATADGLQLCVDDAGPGIGAADRARVFDRFVRLDRSVGRPGSGLGLSIVRAVAEAHGARVELQDSPLGGLRVSVVFPVAVDPAGSPDPGPSR